MTDAKDRETAPAPESACAKDEEETFNPEEEVTEGNWTRPEVEIHEVKVETGEEEEEVFWSGRSKLYRWVTTEGAGEWKERGIGEAKLLKHKTSGKIRFLLRQEKTLKIVANHYVMATDVYCKLTPNVSSEKIYVWTVMDFADGELKNEQFALKFGLAEQALVFKDKFTDAGKLNAVAFGTASSGETKSGAKEVEATTNAKPEDKKEETDEKEKETTKEKTEEAKA